MEGFVFKTPETVNELVQCLKTAGDDTYILGGGTDLVIKFKNEGIYKGEVIDISGINELRYVKYENGEIKIGANTTLTQIAEDYNVIKYAKIISDVAGQVGSKQIRNMARMAGNIANSSVRGDCIPALLACNARLKIINGKGEIFYKYIDEVVVGIGKNTLKKDEAIIEIIVPAMDESYRSIFLKYGMSSKTTVILANVSLSVIVKFDSKNNIIEKASVVIGAAAPTPYHAVKAEKILTGATLRKELALDFEKV